MKASSSQKPVSFLIMVFAVLAMGMFTNDVFAQRYMEHLNRGLVAIKTTSGNFLSWRLFGTDPQDNTFGFNVYKGTTKLNDAIITNATCYQDNSSGSGVYTVKPVTNTIEGVASEEALVISNSYLAIPLTPPPSGTCPDGSSYTETANDCSIGDLDGDGQYEIVLKWDPSNARDNSQSGYTGPTYLDGYKLNGTRLWRINLGKNIRSGAHYTQFMVYDLDGDGKAEVACKTADGTIDGTGAVIGDAAANYVNSSGKIVTGSEFLTIFNGSTGKVLVTTDYNPLRGDINKWGKSGDNANRVDRFLACIAYVDGARPSLVMCRGYYGRSVLAAWNYRNGKLTPVWTFDSDASGNSAYAGQGCHSIRVGDVDGDGFDEIVYGACTIDHTGKGLYSTGLGHGDALHLADMDPARPGLEVWQVHEDAATNGNIVATYRDAKTGTVLWKNSGTADNGRGVAAPLIAGTKSWQMWSAAFTELYDLTGANVGTKPSSQNFAVWWDGDLLRELEDGTTITKYGGTTLLSASGCSSNNSTKATPNLSADIFGDWREEVVWRNNANTELRIYSTTTPTTNRLYTLMHDAVYRLSVASENVAYNQPPEPGIYIGDKMTIPQAKPDIAYYDVPIGISPMTTHNLARMPLQSTIKVFGDESFTVSYVNDNTVKNCAIYNVAGKCVGKFSTRKNTLALKDFGLSKSVYLVRLTNDLVASKNNQ